MRIWKFPLKVADQQTVVLPAGARILCVQEQAGSPCLWALCDETLTWKDDCTVHIYGTGHPMPPDPGAYISTFQMLDGELVFHAFEQERNTHGTR